MNIIIVMSKCRGKPNGEFWKFKLPVKSDTKSNMLQKSFSISIDLILTNRPSYFQHSKAFETKPYDFHPLTVTEFKTNFQKQKPKIIPYRYFKKELTITPLRRLFWTFLINMCRWKENILREGYAVKFLFQIILCLMYSQCIFTLNSN